MKKGAIEVAIVNLVKWVTEREHAQSGNPSAGSACK